MAFRSKRDWTFIILLVIALIIIAVATLWPVVYELFLQSTLNTLQFG